VHFHSGFLSRFLRLRRIGKSRRNGHKGGAEKQSKGSQQRFLFQPLDYLLALWAALETIRGKWDEETDGICLTRKTTGQYHTSGKRSSASSIGCREVPRDGAEKQRKRILCPLFPGYSQRKSCQGTSPPIPETDQLRERRTLNSAKPA